SKVKGELLTKELVAALDDHPNVGDIRGRGLMVGVELVANRETKEPFGRSSHVTERVVLAAKADGLLLYSSTGCADGTDGDLIMVGPPFTLTDDEADLLVARTAAAIATLKL